MQRGGREVAEDEDLVCFDKSLLAYAQKDWTTNKLPAPPNWQRVNLGDFPGLIVVHCYCKIDAIFQGVNDPDDGIKLFSAAIVYQQSQADIIVW